MLAHQSKCLHIPGYDLSPREEAKQFPALQFAELSPWQHLDLLLSTSVGLIIPRVVSRDGRWERENLHGSPAIHLGHREYASKSAAFWSCTLRTRVWLNDRVEQMGQDCARFRKTLLPEQNSWCSGPGQVSTPLAHSCLVSLGLHSSGKHVGSEKRVLDPGSC